MFKSKEDAQTNAQRLPDEGKVTFQTFHSLLDTADLHVLICMNLCSIQIGRAGVGSEQIFSCKGFPP